MKSIFRSILVYLVGVALVFSAPHSEPSVYRLTDADMQRARDIIAAEDNPRLLCESFAGRPRLEYDDNTVVLLNLLIESNRTQSFMSFFPHIRFDGHDSDKRRRYIFAIAAAAHRCEICDYLLSTQGFPGGYGMINGLGDWDMALLKKLLAAHPDRLVELSPGYFRLMFGSDAASILRDLEVIEYGRSISQAFAEKADTEPSFLLFNVIRNETLGDVDMARVLEKVLSMGPIADPKLVDSFKRKHPGFAASNQLLSEYVETPIKEPESK